METWGDELDNPVMQASINNNAVPDILYQVDQFYNGIGSISGVSSARIVGSCCIVAFKNNLGSTLCTLRSDDFPFQSFVHDNGCGNDVVTQYTVQVETGTVFIYTTMSS